MAAAHTLDTSRGVTTPPNIAKTGKTPRSTRPHTDTRRSNIAKLWDSKQKLISRLRSASGQKILQSEANLNHAGDKAKAFATLIQNVEAKMRERFRIPEHVASPTTRPRDAFEAAVPSPVYAKRKKQTQNQKPIEGPGVSPGTLASRRASMLAVSPGAAATHAPKQKPVEEPPVSTGTLVRRSASMPHLSPARATKKFTGLSNSTGNLSRKSSDTFSVASLQSEDVHLAVCMGKVSWLVGQSVGWLIGWLVDRLVGGYSRRSLQSAPPRHYYYYHYNYPSPLPRSTLTPILTLNLNLNLNLRPPAPRLCGPSTRRCGTTAQ